MNKLKTTLLMAFLIHIYFPYALVAAEKWLGVDETVVEKFAKEQGHHPRDPIINTDQGDLLLFLFLIAGTIAGFTAGYYWKELVGRKTKT